MAPDKSAAPGKALRETINRPAWVIEPWILRAILAGLLVYGIVAELVDFQPLGPRRPDTSVLDHRLRECSALWVVACSAVGWLAYARRRRPGHKARYWPLLVVPMAFALKLAVSEAVRQYDGFRELADGSRPFFSYQIDIVMPLEMIIAPLVMGMILALALLSQALLWRQTVVPGVCRVCKYDLRGNVSGRCSECGTPIVTDPDVPAYYFRSSYRWLPELAHFPDAKARYEAWRRARRGYYRRPLAWPLPIGIIAFAVCINIPRWNSWVESRWWLLLGALACIGAVEAVGARRFLRRGLKRELQLREKRPTGNLSVESRPGPECVSSLDSAEPSRGHGG